MRAEATLAQPAAAPVRPALLATGCAGAVVAAATAGYLAAARALTGAGGVPLDDAWIHQTLARNLAAHGQLLVVPGEPSAAATSPLWSGLLAVAYWAGLPPLVWALALGLACLGATAALTYHLASRLFPGVLWLPPATLLLVAAEWRLVWAALSGMETLLFAALTLGALALAAGGHARPSALGLCCGLATAARPEGLALWLLLGVWLVARRQTTARGLAAYGAAAVLPLLPVAALNLAQHGSPLPATFFAKNAAYAAGADPTRVAAFAAGALGVLVRGPELLLLPGLAAMGAAGLRRPLQPSTLPLLWAGGLLLAYALWLPALYHHGRYLFPLLPLALLYGLEGTRRLAQRFQLRRVAAAGVLLTALYAGYGLWRGAHAYAENVAYINGQHVWSALWVAGHTPPGQPVAAHDIGALTYLAPRPIVDMAGLATPALIAGPRDVEGVLRVLRQRNVAVALALPDWYPPLYAALVDRWGGSVVAVGQASGSVDQGQRMHILRRD